MQSRFKSMNHSPNASQNPNLSQTAETEIKYQSFDRTTERIKDPLGKIQVKVENMSFQRDP